MFTLAWSALTSKIAGPVAAAVALALACFLVAVMLQSAGLKGKVAKLETTVANLQVDLRQCQANRVTLEASIDRQNAAVTALSEEAARKARAADKAVRDARAVAESERRRAERALAAKPKTCADLSGLLERTLP